MNLSRREWWFGIAVLAAVLLVHALVPRYEWRSVSGVPVIRVDRWTGRAVRGSYPAAEWVQWAPAPQAKTPVDDLRDALKEK